MYPEEDSQEFWQRKEALDCALRLPNNITPEDVVNCAATFYTFLTTRTPKETQTNG